MKVKWKKTGLTLRTIEFEEGELAGRTYSMGGDNLINRNPTTKYGYWIHHTTIKQIAPVEKSLTDQERLKVVLAIRGAFRENKEAFGDLDYFDFTS